MKTVLRGRVDRPALLLFDANAPCIPRLFPTPLADLDTGKLDGSGDGEGVGSVAVTGQNFYVDAFNKDVGLDNLPTIAHVGGLG